MPLSRWGIRWSAAGFQLAQRLERGRWENAVDRIERGHAFEEEAIRQSHEKMKAKPPSDFWDPDEIAGQAYQETCSITNNMSASLVVTLWSEVEWFLRMMIWSYDTATGQTGTVPLKRRYSSIGQMIDDLPIAADDVWRCSEVETANAVRILCNAFKHDDGQYNAQGRKREETIDNALLAKWGILQGDDKIDYAKLPIIDMVSKCEDFCLDLGGKCQKGIESLPQSGQQGSSVP